MTGSMHNATTALVVFVTSQFSFNVVVVTLRTEAAGDTSDSLAQYILG
jgi:hypothetical protein